MLAWKPNLILGVCVIDTHHKRLIALTNEVIASTKAPAPPAAVRAKLSALIEFTAWHFRFEEDLMVETAYQDNTHHSEQHGELLGQLRRFAERIDRGTAGPLQSAKTFSFLGNWVTQHIRLTDRPLAAHLLDRGWDPVRDNLI